ncbi:MAG: transporter, partial [Candidatus Hydrogenedentes bacterium]|nr:transporter [Candidatus Hydrogenedentota bacterium]
SGGPAHSLDGGFTFLLRENIQWDLFVGVGLSDDADDWFVGTGLCFRFPR